jgi:hypothetical protein
MSGTLGALSRLASTPPGTATVETVVAACAEIRRLFDADDAYVVRSGDPAFVRLGDDGDPAQYEIKQRGYWYAWREAAANPGEPNRLLTVTTGWLAMWSPAQVPATHIAAILPGESNSEMLIVRGPWPTASVRPGGVAGSVRLEAYTDRQRARGERRRRRAVRVLGEIAEAFTQAEHADNPLSGAGDSTVPGKRLRGSSSPFSTPASSASPTGHASGALEHRDSGAASADKSRTWRTRFAGGAPHGGLNRPGRWRPDEQLLVNDELRLHNGAHPFDGVLPGV